MEKTKNLRTADLRIGNLINAYRIGVCCVDGIESDILISTKIDEYIPIEDVEGIPLNEQWLFNFGFEHELRNEYAISIGDYTLLLSIEKDFISVVYNYLWGAYDSEATFLKSIIYVHQLQNLYFALFQEELILKE